MIYIVSRASTWNEKPCDEAKMQMVKTEHIRTCSEKEFNFLFSQREGLWRDNGFEHQTCDDGILRYENKERWTIEINTLEELDNFINKYGSIIINNNDFLKEIQIYDDYIE